MELARKNAGVTIPTPSLINNGGPTMDKVHARRVGAGVRGCRPLVGPSSSLVPHDLFAFYGAIVTIRRARRQRKAGGAQAARP